MSVLQEYRPLAYGLARRFAWGNRDVPLDDLRNVALIALDYAARRYDPSRCKEFGTFATMVIRHQLIALVRSWQRWRLPSLTDVSDDEGNGPEATARPDVDLDVAEAAAHVLAGLPERLGRIIRMISIDGMTFVEAGRRLGISRQRAQRVYAKAICQARAMLPEWEHSRT